MKKNSKIYIAGHRGLVGSAIKQALEQRGFVNLVYRTHDELDLTVQRDVALFFEKERPEYVFLAGAKVGGINANDKFPAQFIYENLMIQSNVIHQSYLHNVKKLLFLGSSCIYPKYAPQPIKEDSLLTGELEPTNLPYAVAKISGIKMCQSYNRQYGTNFVSVMPCNLYGPRDNFDLETSHVIPALIRKFHEAKENNNQQVTLWGTGSPLREFLYVDDMAEGCLFVMEHFNPTKEQNESGDVFVNLGSGIDITIKELAELIKNTIGYKGNIVWDATKPNGTPRKLLDVSKLKKLGWHSTTSLDEGIAKTYEWYKEVMRSNA